MLLAAFVALGRVFDQDSEHNLDHLKDVAATDLSIFSKATLRLRKEASISKEQAAAFVQNAHELTPADIRLLKGQIRAKRGIYEARYREIRNKVFAHNNVPDVAQVNKLFAKTNINEMKGIFGFLHALYGALDLLFLNGSRPEVRPYVFRLPPQEPRPGRIAPGERVYREAQTTLTQLRPIP